MKTSPAVKDFAATLPGKVFTSGSYVFQFFRGSVSVYFVVSTRKPRFYPSKVYRHIVTLEYLSNAGANAYLVVYLPCGPKVFPVDKIPVVVSCE